MSLRPRRRAGRDGEPRATLAVQIVQAAMQPDVSVAALAELAQADPAFAAQLLSVVNSAAFGLRVKVVDVPRAASMLGVAGVKNVALSLSLSQMAPPGDDGLLLLTCCLRRGIAARLVAERLTERAHSGEAFAVGLFLDAALLQRPGVSAAVAATIACQPADGRIVTERAAGLVPHPEVGAAMAAEWALPDEVLSAIAHHHDAAPPPGELPAIAWAAECLAAVYESGEVLEAQAAAQRSLAAVGLSSRVVGELLAAIPERVSSVAARFERPIDHPDIEALVQGAHQQLVELNKSYHLTVRHLETLLAEKEDLALELAAANARLERMAATDPLTALCNRRAFHDALDQHAHRSARAGAPLSLLMIDVDHFKKLNDTHGHQAGDEVLRGLGRCLLDATRGADVPARYGGEEFSVILPDTTVQGALVVAERVRAAVAAMDIETESATLHITVSIGAATVCSADAHQRADELIAVADEALYCAKDGGRNRVVGERAVAPVARSSDVVCRAPGLLPLAGAAPCAAAAD